MCVRRELIDVEIGNQIFFRKQKGGEMEAGTKTRTEGDCLSRLKTETKTQKKINSCAGLRVVH